MDEQYEGVSAESPAASEPTYAADPSAGTQNTEFQPQAPGPIPYDRFQQMVHARQQAEQRAAMLEQQYQTLQQRIQQAQAQRQRQAPQQWTDDHHKASEALEQLLMNHPRFQPLQRALQQVSAMQQWQQEQYVRGGVNEVARFITESGLPTDIPGGANTYEAFVAAVIANDPQLLQRYRGGDMSALAEAVNQAKSFFGRFTQPAQVAAQNQLIDTKNQVRRLPRPQGAGAPGAPMPAELPADASQDDLRAYRQNMHADAARIIAAAQAATR